MRVTIIGAGYVGLTTGVALAHIGHDVAIVEADLHRLNLLESGKSPIHEVGLEALMHLVRERLYVTAHMREAVPSADVVVVAVGTPARSDGNADTRHVESAAQQAAEHFRDGQSCTLVIKSTVPIGTHRRVEAVVSRILAQRASAAKITLASNPEFLREGQALRDMFYPDRIVVGAESSEAFSALERLYKPILDRSFLPLEFLHVPDSAGLPRLVATDPSSAEMIKYAANAFVAVKISFINEIAGLCERVGADVTEVAHGIGLDPRIGPEFLRAGIGWGGSCLPKDTAAVLGVAGEFGYSMPLVEAARSVNEKQKMLAVDKLQAALKVLRGRTIAVLGLAFKPGTDDVRESTSLAMIRLLVERGAHVHAHDPIALDNARVALAGVEDIDYVPDVTDAARGADALVIATDWDLYRQLPLRDLAGLMRTPVLVDGRNLIEPEDALQSGFSYFGIGRPEQAVGRSVRSESE